MAEPEKPFACTIPDCGMTFTNEDHLHVHTKKHDMLLQFGPEQKAAFVVDQTPTPTRFIRNCEEVGLFQDLQNVNPFDEGFKRAMDTKHGMLSLESIATSSSDDLHTPQMVYPLIDSGDSALFSTTNNQRNITISRSSSDESGAIKEFETTTISKLTNEVTTISRIVGKHEDVPKHDEQNRSKEEIRTDSISYTNNVIKIHSNVEIRKESDKNPVQTLISYEDTVIKDSIVTKDVSISDTSKLQVPQAPPIMSQKSIDFVVDSLTSDFSTKDDGKRNIKKDDENYEVFIKLPGGKHVRMKAVEEINEEYVQQQNAKEKLKKVLINKAEVKNPLQRIQSMPNAQIISNIMPNLVPITTGTLIPVSLVGQNQLLPKVPIQLLPVEINKQPVKRKSIVESNSKFANKNITANGNRNQCEVVSGCPSNGIKRNSLTKQDLESRSAASRRYRARLKEAWSSQAQEIRQLKEINQKLSSEKASLKLLITEHMKKCPNAEDLRDIKDKLNQSDTII